MKIPSSIPARSLLHALGALAYISGVATLMRNGEALFGNEPSTLGVVSFLMLFVLSAAVMGLLVFGKPVTLFLDSQRKEAVWFLTATIAWLGILTSLALLVRIFLAA